MKRVPRLFLPLFLCSAAVVHGAATGRLAGTVTDQEGQPVTGATIRVVDVISDKELASTAVRRDASYAFDGVPEGTCFLAVHVSGYRPFESKTVTVLDSNGRYPDTCAVKK